MDVDIGLTVGARSAIATEIRKVLGETYALYIKTHGYHWNVTGPHFQSLHTLFETQYRELWAALDILSERLRAIGEFAPGSSEELMAAASIKPDNGVPAADAMVTNLLRGHETIAKAAKAAAALAEAQGDVVTADLMTVRTEASEKAAWMLRASL